MTAHITRETAAMPKHETPMAPKPAKPDLRRHELDAMSDDGLTAFGRTWYALEVDPQRELVVRYDIRQAGFEAWCPIRTRWIRKNRYTKTRFEKPFPQLPRYVFVGFEPDQPVPWFDICAIDHVHGPLGNHGRPSEVRTMQLQAMMQDQLLGKWRAENRERGMMSQFLRIGDIIPTGALKLPIEDVDRDLQVTDIRGRTAVLDGLGLLGATVIQVDVNSIDFTKVSTRR